MGARLDYCNSLLDAGTSVSNLSRLQDQVACSACSTSKLVQNTLARVVAQKSRFDHITPVLSELHWLPVRHRINFKIAAITHDGPAVSAALLDLAARRFHAMRLCDHSAPRHPCRYVFLCVKPPWQPLDRFRWSHQKFGMHCRVIFVHPNSSLLSEELSNTIFSCLLISDSRTIWWHHAIRMYHAMRDTTPPAAIVLIENTMPSS